MKARTPYLTLLSANTTALLVIMVAAYLMSERASAQRIPPPSDPVLAAVQDVQRSIVGLQVNLDALQSGLDLQLAPMSVNFRWTPPADATFDTVGCSVVNISGVQKTIHVELKKSDGTNEAEETADVAPGATAFVGSDGPRWGLFHCKFTVIGGTRADIRGALLGHGAGYRSPGQEFSFQPSFQVPAE